MAWDSCGEGAEGIPHGVGRDGLEAGWFDGMRACEIAGAAKAGSAGEGGAEVGLGGTKGSGEAGFGGAVEGDGGDV